MSITNTFRLQSLADTDRLAAALADQLSMPLPNVPMAIGLTGPLGAGKTQLVRSLASHLGIATEMVTSPTYVLVQRYYGRLTLIHLDFYRLSTTDQVWDLGLDEWLAEPALTVIEWCEKFPQCLPEELLSIELSLVSETIRSARLTARGARATAILDALPAALGT